MLDWKQIIVGCNRNCILRFSVVFSVGDGLSTHDFDIIASLFEANIYPGYKMRNQFILLSQCFMGADNFLCTSY